MKLLIVTQYFWPETFIINDLALGLREMGHEIEVLTGMPNYPSGSLFPGYSMTRPRRDYFEGIPIRRVPLIPRFKGRGWNLFLNYLSFALSASVIGPMRCKSRYDIIFVFEPSPITVGLPAMVFKKVSGAPVIFWVQDLWPESLMATGAVTSKKILAGVRFFVRLLYRRCDRILVQSRAFIAPIVSLGVAKETVTFFPNSAESLYRPLELEPDAAERKKVPVGFIVMFAGNIGADQDFPTILKAAETLKTKEDIHFVILGDGRQYTWLKSQVARRGLGRTFHLLGRYPVTAMPRFFALADTLLVSLRKEPIFKLTIPSKVQSYMACGRPILAALDGEGARVVSETGAGIACGAENPGELAKSILEMYNLPETERKKMGEKGLKYFKENFERTLLLKRLDKMMKTMQWGTMK